MSLLEDMQLFEYPDHTPEAMGRRLRAIRSVRGITQRQLAESSNVPIGSIKQVEQGNSRVGPDKVLRISEALNLPVDFIYFGNPRWIETGLLESLRAEYR